MYDTDTAVYIMLLPSNILPENIPIIVYATMAANIVYGVAFVLLSVL